MFDHRFYYIKSGFSEETRGYINKCLLTFL